MENQPRTSAWPMHRHATVATDGVLTGPLVVTGYPVSLALSTNHALGRCPILGVWILR